MSDVDYRSWGETKNCHGCRYWSEMLARSSDSEDGWGIEAYCLNHKSSMRGRYTSRQQSCKEWESGELGAVDSPGGDPYQKGKAKG